MHRYAGCLVAAFALSVWVSWATPVCAQQSGGQPARAGQATGRGGDARQALPPVSGSRQPRRQAAPRAPQRGAPQDGSRVRPAAGQAPTGNAAPQPPFTLTAQQQQLLDRILVQWENQSARVRTFKCTFGRWEVNRTFGPPNNNYWLTISEGEIKFKAPDHGIYIVKKQQEWDRQRKAYVPRTEALDHWVCDGKSIFEYNEAKRQLIERKLAPELQGKAITDGPLPFIFGARADQLKRRYWMRDVTPPDQVNKKVWLEAWPKFQQDAANFQHSVVILDQRNFIPEALRVILPDGKNMQDYAFSGTQVNDPLSIFKGDFLPPITPLGWQKVVEPAQSHAVGAPAKPPAQARRPAAAPRK